MWSINNCGYNAGVGRSEGVRMSGKRGTNFAALYVSIIHIRGQIFWARKFRGDVTTSLIVTACLYYNVD
jgi:hypothetical protein